MLVATDVAGLTVSAVGAPEQDQREAGLAGFREDKFNVLVATDVAGLTVSAVGAPEQDQREAGLSGFCEDKFNVLVATDVGSRCLLCAKTGPARGGPGRLPRG